MLLLAVDLAGVARGLSHRSAAAAALPPTPPIHSAGQATSPAAAGGEQ